MDTQLARWGNSLAVRIPKDVAEKAKIREGDAVSLSIAKDGAVVIRRARRAVTLEGLIEGITEENRHAETDWGGPRGKEIW